MGGKRNAQLLAAVACSSRRFADGRTLIMYFAFDYLWWWSWLFSPCACWRPMTRVLAGIGAGIGCGMMTKYTMAFWVAGLAVAVLITSTRKYLRSKWLYLGAALALLIYLPNLIWQIQHGFISLKYSLHSFTDIQWGRTNDFLPRQLYETTNPLSLPLWLTGLIACFCAASLKRFRPLAGCSLRRSSCSSSIADAAITPAPRM